MTDRAPRPAILFNPWTWKMAWRDSRRSRSHLLLYSTSIMLGIAVFVALGSFRAQLEKAVDEQSKTLLGADLVVASRDPFTEEQLQFISSIGGRQAREVSFSSMVYSIRSEGSRLAQIRAVESGFPFYGALETAPPPAARAYQPENKAVVEAGLLAQLGAVAGDSLKIGDLTVPVAGELRKVPGETIMFSTLAPRVYVPFALSEKMGLLGEKSLARYRVYFSLDANMDALMDRLRPRLRELQLDWDTVAQRRESLGRSVNNLYQFLNLCGFASVLLGAVGIASAIHSHIREKLVSIAVLRCVGAAGNHALAVYLIQALGVGIIGAIGGAALGLALQAVLPYFARSLLPVESEFLISWSAVGRGMGMGVAVCLAFALAPLASVRRVSPLAAIRLAHGMEPEKRRRNFLLFGVTLAILLLAVVAFSPPERRLMSLACAGGITAALALLAFVSWLLMRALRRGLPASLPFVIRQGASNLHRPNNRTILVTVALGLGAFFVLTIGLLQTALIRQITSTESQGNTLLFDIQSDQYQPILDELRQRSLPLLESAPIVTMRIQSINGRTVPQISADKALDIPRWALNREYRSTFRGEVNSGEKLVSGQWHARADANAEVIPVSLETGIAETLQVKLGDEIVFDVQGIPMTTRIASLREVDWKRLQPNFFVVFPEGVLEEAPMFRILVTKVPASDAAGTLQRDLVLRFPNVSVVDLDLILKTVNGLLEKFSVVIRFMSAFLAGTGLLVLVAVVAAGRYQRARESVLLRTLGASRRQVRQIFLTEYVCLGFVAALGSAGLALPAAWALSKFAFEISFSPAWGWVAAVFGSVCAATAIAGLLLNRGVANQPPLQILRAEA